MRPYRRASEPSFATHCSRRRGERGDVGAEIGLVGVAAVRGSIRAAYAIGGDLGIVTKGSMKGGLQAAGDLGSDLGEMARSTARAAVKVASDLGVSRLDVGAMIDRLGIRVTECRLGCFAVSKTSHLGSASGPVGEELARRVETLAEKGELTCANVFAIARELNVKPLAVADAANVQGYKVRQCQLGCF